MTTQDNNEAASDRLHNAIMNLPCDESQAHGDPQTAYKYGHRDARHAAAELVSEAASTPNCRMHGGVCACRSGGSYGGCAIERGFTTPFPDKADYLAAASASQSSTAGAAKGGVTCPDCHGVGTYLGNDGGYSDDSCDTCDGSGLAHVARQESGAIAEGVDTDALKLQMARFRTESNSTVHEERDRLLAMFTTYGAQQREAGRREVEVKLRALRSAFHANMLRAFPDKSHVEITAEIDKALAPLALSAAPPAKAEGMMKIADGYDGGTLAIDPKQEIHTINLHYKTAAQAEAAFDALANHIDAAILAQQAKGEQQ